MGYYTDFSGNIELNVNLGSMSDFVELLESWLRQRHVTMDPDVIKALDPEWERKLICGSDIYEGGWNYVHGGRLEPDFDDYGDAILEWSIQPLPCPSIWSDLSLGIYDNVITPIDGQSYGIVFGDDGCSWLDILFRRILPERGITGTGKIEWQGDDYDDYGVVNVSPDGIEVIDQAPSCSLHDEHDDDDDAPEHEFDL